MWVGHGEIDAPQHTATLASSGEQRDDHTDARTHNARPAVHRLDLGLRDRGLEAATGQNSMAESGNRPRLVARCPLGECQIADRVLAARVRLAPVRVGAQSFPTIPDHDRWAGYSLHPCQVQEPERDAAHLDSWMARFDRRIPETDWPADRPGGVRGKR